MIYENDIPSKEDAETFWDDYLVKMICKKLLTDARFKPNGITDNRERYETQKYWRIWLKIQAEIQDIEIARSHDITKSDMGFK